MVNTIIFDLDGTLLDTLTDIASAMNRTFIAFSLPPQPLSVYQQLVGGGSRNMVDSLVPEHLDRQRIFDHYLTDYQHNLLVDTRPYPGLHQVLRDFQQAGIKLAVVTNKHHHQAVFLLEQLFDDIHFHSVQGLLDGIAKKPHPQMAITALQQAGSLAQETLFVGDTETDMKTANAAAIKAVYAHWGYGDFAAMADVLVEFTITQISDLPPLIQASAS